MYEQGVVTTPKRTLPVLTAGTGLVTHRDKMIALEQKIAEELELHEFETEHYYAEGTYTRVMFVPKGYVLTGHIHRESCINIIPKGKMLVSTDEGDKEVEAPAYFVSGAGVKKAGYALEDTIWINVFPNADGCQEPDTLVERLTYIEGYEQLDRESQEQLDIFEE